MKSTEFFRKIGEFAPVVESLVKMGWNFNFCKFTSRDA